MTEPVLTYRKNEGWVYETVPSANGKYLTLYNRKPEIGEHYTFITYSGPDDSWFKDGVLDMNIVAGKDGYFTYNKAMFMKYDGKPFGAIEQDSRTRFITVVPL